MSGTCTSLLSWCQPSRKSNAIRPLPSVCRRGVSVMAAVNCFAHRRSLEFKKKNSTIARRAARLAERASVHGMPSPVFDFLTSLHVLRPLVPWGRRTKLSGGRRIHCRETVFHFKELAVNGFLKCSIWTLQHLVSASWRE